MSTSHRSYLEYLPKYLLQIYTKGFPEMLKAIIVEKLRSCDNKTDEQKWEYTPIKEFYSNSNILVTGCTGYLGRLLVEKLLRSCPKISKVFVLVRQKKGKSMKTRLEELFDDVVFQRLKRVCPDFQKKVVGIEGDCLLPDLGINEQDKSLLIKEVNIIFHAAATVRFDEKLKTAAFINVRATRDLLRLAQLMPQLKSYMHISTAYTNCPQKVIEEKIYPAAMDYKKLLMITESFPDEVLDDITTRLLGEYPNTYAFTKQIAEDVVKCEGQELPIGISRPSIVISTYKEPIRGWINNLYGPTGVGLGAGTGVIRALKFDVTKNANLVPGDMCVNSIIAAAWEVDATFNESKEKRLKYEIPLYNFESSNDKPITWGDFMTLCGKYGLQTPAMRSIWYYCFNSYPCTIQYMLAEFFLQTIPAYIIDRLLVFKGKTPRMMKLYSKVSKMNSVLSYFCTNEWTFTCLNVQKLLRKMSDKDREIFFFDLKNLDWDDFFQTYMPGGRVYVLKDPIETLPEAKKRWKRLYWAHQTLKAVGGLLLLCFLWFMFSFVLNSFSGC